MFKLLMFVFVSAALILGSAYCCDPKCPKETDKGASVEVKQSEAASKEVIVEEKAEEITPVVIAQAKPAAESQSAGDDEEKIDFEKFAQLAEEIKNGGDLKEDKKTT